MAKNVKINFTSFRFIGKSGKICKFFPPKTPSKQNSEIYTALLFQWMSKRMRWGMYTCWEIKITKKLTQSQLCAFIVEPHSVAEPLPRGKYISMASKHEVYKRRRRKSVMENEEKRFFTEKSCTRKDINALAFFPLRLIENYIPSLCFISSDNSVKKKARRKMPTFVMKNNCSLLSLSFFQVLPTKRIMEIKVCHLTIINCNFCTFLSSPNVVVVFLLSIFFLYAHESERK